jgi:hypothetical protein
VAVHGLFDVEEMSLAGVPLPPSDAKRWRRVAVRRNGINVYETSGEVDRYRSAKFIAGPGQLALSESADVMHERRALLELREEDEGPQHVVLEGEWYGAPLRAHLRRTERGFPLMTRGFHWINDTSYYR